MLVAEALGDVGVTRCVPEGPDLVAVGVRLWVNDADTAGPLTLSVRGECETSWLMDGVRCVTLTLLVVERPARVAENDGVVVPSVTERRGADTVMVTVSESLRESWIVACV